MRVDSNWARGLLVAPKDGPTARLEGLGGGGDRGNRNGAGGALLTSFGAGWSKLWGQPRACALPCFGGFSGPLGCIHRLS